MALGVDSTSNRNHYQESSCGYRTAGRTESTADNLTTFLEMIV
jgi:hypothetical protein